MKSLETSLFYRICPVQGLHLRIKNDWRRNQEVLSVCEKHETFRSTPMKKLFNSQSVAVSIKDLNS